MKKVLVCGYGSIGQKHARNLREMDTEIRVWRQQSGEGQAIEQDGFIFEPSLDEGLGWCDAAVIATATDSHIEPALRAAQVGRHLYLEKPVSHNRDGVEALVQAAKGLVVEVGCQMRQHPNLKVLHQKLQKGEDGSVLAFQAWVGQRLDQWRPGRDYRKGYSADPARGGGALFDLVHEVDLMTWMAGPVKSVYADLRHNSDLEMDAEDLANLVLVTEGGAAGTVQLDMLSPAYRRGLQIVCSKAVYRWEMKEGKLWRDDGNGPVCVDEISAGYVAGQMLPDAMAYFLKRIDNASLAPCCSLQEGVHDLDILLAAREASQSGMRQELGEGSI